MKKGEILTMDNDLFLVIEQNEKTTTVGRLRVVEKVNIRATGVNVDISIGEPVQVSPTAEVYPIVSKDMRRINLNLVSKSLDKLCRKYNIRTVHTLKKYEFEKPLASRLVAEIDAL